MKATFSDQIRRAVRESGVTAYRICRLTGIDKAAMSRFLSGERFLSEDSLNMVAEVLGLRVKGKAKKGE